MSGGKSAAPQVNGSNGSAPNMSLPKEEEEEGLFFPSFYMPLKLTSTIYDSKKTAYATRPYGWMNQYLTFQRGKTYSSL